MGQHTVYRQFANAESASGEGPWSAQERRRLDWPRFGERKLA